MAARKNKVLHAEKTKNLIRASQLLNRLNKHAKGECEMSATQIKAAQIVINKEIPDLARIEHTGKEGGPLQIQVVRFADSPSTS